MRSMRMPVDKQPLIDPAGRPHLACRKCRVAVTWSTDLSIDKANEFADATRRDPLEGRGYAENVLGLDPREAKVLTLHVTRVKGTCHRCGRPVRERDSICECGTANLDW